MRVHIDDEDVVEIALHRLLAGMRQEARGVELVDRYASAAFCEQVHGFVSCQILLLQRPVQLCHMPSSNTARLAARKRPLAVIMTSVGVTLVRCASAAIMWPDSIRVA